MLYKSFHFIVFIIVYSHFLFFQGERRIRIHTLCFPVVKDPIEVIKNADAVACISLLSKMGWFYLLNNI